MWGIIGVLFDCIVGNPPYQNANSKNQGSSRKLWMYFFEQSIKVLKDDGYLCLIHPPAWRNWKGWMWSKYYQKYQVIEVVLDPVVDWNVGVRVDYYLLQKTPYTVPTIVNGTKMDFRLLNGIVLDEEVAKLLYDDGPKCNFQQSCLFESRKPFLSKTKTSTHIYPIAHSSKSVLWSDKPHPLQYTPKVLVSYSGYMYPRYDDNMGITQQCYYHIVKDEEEANQLINYINSETFQQILKVMKTNGFNDKKILNSIPSQIIP